MKGNEITLEHSNTVNNKEMRILLSVMHKYNLKLLNVEKVRSAYKIITDSGKFCLKKRKHGKSKIKNGCILTEELLLNKFTNTAKYFRSKDGSFSVKCKKNIFFLTEWIEGHECNLNNIDEAINCTKLLAKFHNVSNIIDNTKINIPIKFNNWPKVFASSLNDFQKFKRIIDNKRIKNEFDILFIENFENFYKIGMSAIDGLNKSQYYKSIKYANDNMRICHNSFYYQNIIKKDGEYFITDFDSIAIDLQLSDLGNLIRRLMFKKAYEWNFYFARTLIEAYNSINKLNKEDLEIMLALIIFPYKYWKLGRKRYIRHRKWSESKYLHKLIKMISYSEAQQNFFYDYSAFLKEYI